MIEVIKVEKRTDKYDGKTRSFVLCKCSKCDKPFWRLKKEVDRNKRKGFRNIFCSKECSKNQTKVVCGYCQKEFEISQSKTKNSRSGIYFCCREHKDLAQRFDFGLKQIWPSHYGTDCKYRIKAFRIFEPKCFKCGYNEYKEALEVHHKDGNRENNQKENLVILCCNCHALITFSIIDL